MVSDLDAHNKQVIRRFLGDMADGLKEEVDRTIVNMDLPSHIPKEVSFRDSIGWYWSDEHTIKLGSSLIYAHNIEWGRLIGARKPPIEPIIKWCMYKLKKEEKEARSMAWVIRESMSKKGIKPRRVFKISLVSFIRKHSWR